MWGQKGMLANQWVVEVLQDLIEYSFLNGLSETATMLMVTRHVAEDETGPKDIQQPTNVLNYSSFQKRQDLRRAAPRGEHCDLQAKSSNPPEG